MVIDEIIYLLNVEDIYSHHTNRDRHDGHVHLFISALIVDDVVYNNYITG